jgi:hypothetical protein
MGDILSNVEATAKGFSLFCGSGPIPLLSANLAAESKEEQGTRRAP